MNFKQYILTEGLGYFLLSFKNNSSSLLVCDREKRKSMYYTSSYIKWNELWDIVLYFIVLSAYCDFQTYCYVQIQW